MDDVASLVRAAGGVVCTQDSALKVLLVHRPRYDDWTFPKGKVAPGEREEDCALREVEEETGLRCALESELPATTYFDRKGRPKRVRYWRMRVLSGSFEPNGEVDEVRWCTLPLAASSLSYERDVRVLEGLS